LIFELASGRYALREAAVAGLIECRPLHAVPGAPAAVIGLTDWRGHVMTLIDLHQVLDDAPGQGQACIVRLAAPLERSALRVHATLRPVETPVAMIEESRVEGDAPWVQCRLEHDGRIVSLLDPQAIIRRVVASMAEQHC